MVGCVVKDHSCLRKALEFAVAQERERCAKVAEERTAYSTESNPSEADLAWKRCARVIAKKIRQGT
jgi:hypothetical protein